MKTHEIVTIGESGSVTVHLDHVEDGLFEIVLQTEEMDKFIRKGVGDASVRGVAVGKLRHDREQVWYEPSDGSYNVESESYGQILAAYQMAKRAARNPAEASDERRKYEAAMLEVCA